VLTQYQPLELNDYIGNGQPWDLDRMNGGVHILSPYQQIKGTAWYKGTANAIYQNINFIERYNPEYVLILSGITSTKWITPNCSPTTKPKMPRVPSRCWRFRGRRRRASG
jgi:hypothetical protein